MAPMWFYIFRGQRTDTLTGERRHTDTVVVQFPDQNTLSGWYAWGLPSDYYIEKWGNGNGPRKLRQV